MVIVHRWSDCWNENDKLKKKKKKELRINEYTWLIVADVIIMYNKEYLSCVLKRLTYFFLQEA